MRVLEYYGLLDKIREAGAVELDMHHLLRYSDGDVLYERPERAWFEKEFGNAWQYVSRPQFSELRIRSWHVQTDLRMECHASS